MIRKALSPLFIVMTMTAGIAIAGTNTFNKLVDHEGNISLPENYRTEWTYLGSYFVKTGAEPSMSSEDSPAPASFESHTVFTQSSSAEYYRQHGRFPDGAVLVKDVNDTQAEPLTTGFARYQGDPKVVFVMVKDTKNRFPENQAWGEGWGWALFNAGDTTNQTTNWKGDGLSNCFGCHLPVKHQDWTYTQGYQGSLKKR